MRELKPLEETLPQIPFFYYIKKKKTQINMHKRKRIDNQSKHVGKGQT